MGQNCAAKTRSKQAKRRSAIGKKLTRNTRRLRK